MVPGKNDDVRYYLLPTGKGQADNTRKTKTPALLPMPTAIPSPPYKWLLLSNRRVVAFLLL